jgi:multidrug efflux pump subunit AcrA (membrane-fusion protein)
MRDAMAAGERTANFSDDVVARRTSAEPPRATRVKPRRGFSPFLLLILALAIAGGVYWLRFRPVPPPPAPAAPVAVPISAAAVKAQDVPVQLAAIGSIQAANTVVIRSRVDGELQKVAFQEGQMVKAGDLLALIDPRPFQAALDQAVATKAQHEAQRANLFAPTSSGLTPPGSSAIRRPRRSTSSLRRSPATKRRSKTPRRSSPIRGSRRLFPAAPAFGSSTRVTSSMPPIRTAS